MGTKNKYFQKVRELLRQSGIAQAPVNVEAVAKALGICVQKSRLPDSLSGLLVNDNSTEMPIIGVNSLHPKVRQRFTIAHEIGHFLLHKSDPVQVDREYSIQFRNAESSTAKNIREREANSFAAELLMPADFLRAELGYRTIDIADEEHLVTLANKYQVSLQAIIYRLMNLGYLAG